MTKNTHSADCGLKPNETSAADHGLSERSASQTDSSSSELSMDFTDHRKNFQTMLILNELMGTLLLQLMVKQELL